jgi:hypothetical protein
VAAGFAAIFVDRHGGSKSPYAAIISLILGRKAELKASEANREGDP